MKVKSGRDMKIANVTKDDYIVPAGEEHLYHVKQEVRQFDPKTGKRLSTPVVQKYGRKAFDTTLYDDLVKGGYTVEVLHDPTEYLKQQATENAKRVKQATEAHARKAAEAKKAEKEAMKAEILDELRKAGILPPVEGNGEKSEE